MPNDRQMALHASELLGDTGRTLFAFEPGGHPSVLSWTELRGAPPSQREKHLYDELACLGLRDTGRAVGTAAIAVCSKRAIGPMRVAGEGGTGT